MAKSSLYLDKLVNHIKHINHVIGDENVEAFCVCDYNLFVKGKYPVVFVSNDQETCKAFIKSY